MRKEIKLLNCFFEFYNNNKKIILMLSQLGHILPCTEEMFCVSVRIKTPKEIAETIDNCTEAIRLMAEYTTP